MRRMLKLVLFSVCLLNAAAAAAQATQKYNPHSERWETTSPDSELKYHPESGNWNYTGQNATPKYYPRENRWDMAPPNYGPHFNYRLDIPSLNSRPQNIPNQTNGPPTSPVLAPQSPRWGNPR